MIVVVLSSCGNQTRSPCGTAPAAIEEREC